MANTLQCDRSHATPGERVTVTLTFEQTGKPHAVRWTWDQDQLTTTPNVRGVRDSKEEALYTVTGAKTRSSTLSFDVQPGASGTATVRAEARMLEGTVHPDEALEAFNAAAGGDEEVQESFAITASGAAGAGHGPGFGNGLPAPVEVTMRRAAVDPTPSQALWTLIRQSTNALSFENYQAFMEIVLCGAGDLTVANHLKPTFSKGLPWRLPFPGVEPYRQLKAATEIFLMLNCGVPFSSFMNPYLSPTQQWAPQRVDVPAELADESDRYDRPVNSTAIRHAWDQLLNEGSGALLDVDPSLRTILYLALVRANLPDVQVLPGKNQLSPQASLELDQGAVTCMEILQQKLTHPCLIELLWDYWHEEGLLVQTMNAITWRFQNRRGPSDNDPLAALEIDPLRPLNNFLWGYIQDEQHRLTVVRRAYEYAHEYGLPLLGKAVPAVRGADNRSRFIEGLHNLLNLCSVFYKQDDDTTVIADGFPLLNALKDVHLQLTQGAANQYGDLPWTARLEMLMQQWLLARPEFREFLPRRVMVDYPETWMHSVESMKAVQGWTTPSVLHFRDLAVFGEQILLGVRFEAWPSKIKSEDAANWARYWRPEIQGYIYAYRAATGVDLTERADATAPGLLLQRRLRDSMQAPAQDAIPASTRGSISRSRRPALGAAAPIGQLPAASRAADRDGR